MLDNKVFHYGFYFGVALIAILIDATLLHHGLYVFGFDVPENFEYFASKYLVVVFSIWLFSHIGNFASQTLLAGFGGSAIFSAYYALSRPDALGIADNSAGYYTYNAPVLTFEQDIVIYLVHALGIAVAYIVFYVVEQRDS